MAYSYKGSISFGLVYIPVTLHSTIKENDIGFNMIDKKTMSRVKYKKTCADCEGREVRQEDIVKGFEYEDGKYVIFEEKDFEKIKSKKDKNITIEKFVNLSEVDPLYFDKPYYVVPTGAEKAFAVLLSAMEQEGKAAIAKTVLGTKETLILIRAKDGQMLLNTLFFEEEVTKNPAKEITEKGNAAELKMAKAIIEVMTGEFNPEEYRDEKLAKTVTDNFVNMNAEMRNKQRLFCLAESPFIDSMWAYYSDESRGFCVEYDFNKGQCLHTDIKRVLLNLFKVKYRQKRRAFSFIDMLEELIINGKQNRDNIIKINRQIFEQVLTKNLDWRHEKE